MSRSTIPGRLDQAALARMHFHTLERTEQEAAIRRLATSGQGEHTIAHATGLSVEQIRRVIGARASADVYTGGAVP